MKRIRNLALSLMLVLLAAMTAGCGKEDKLVMVTTEKRTESQEQTEEQNTEKQAANGTTVGLESGETTEEPAASTEAASEEERALTLEQIYFANGGDKLLSTGKGCSINTIYYSAGTEVYSEYRYLGFDENGAYIQAYEDSDGRVEVLDNYNQCWYVVEENRIWVKLYPEDGVAASMIDFNHNDMILSLDGDEAVEQISDIYREEGRLTVETRYVTELEEPLTNKYVLAEDYSIEEIYCYDCDGELLSYAWVTKDAVYNMPEPIVAAMYGGGESRTIQIAYPNGDGLDNMFSVPKDYPVVLKLLAYEAYTDESLHTKWSEEQPDADGVYGDVTIYLKYGKE